MNATVVPTRAAPVKATWICLSIAWLLFLIPLPGAGLFVGWPLNLVAFILAIVVMARGKTAGGLIPLLASVIVSPIVYFIGLAIFGAAFGGDAYKDYAEKVQAAQEAAAASSQDDDSMGSEVEPPLEVSAADLFAAYEANEVAADNQYKGKQLAVFGTVTGISKDFTDEVYVEIGTSNQFMSIHARDIDPAVAADLQKGTEVTVVCEGGGLMVGSPILNECVVL